MDPQILRVKTMALDFIIAWPSIWEIFLAYHFHKTLTPLSRSEEHKCTLVSQATLSQLAYSLAGKKWTSLDVTVRCYRAFALPWVQQERAEDKLQLESEPHLDEGSGLLGETPLRQLLKTIQVGHVTMGNRELQSDSTCKWQQWDDTWTHLWNSYWPQCPQGQRKRTPVGMMGEGREARDASWRLGFLRSI